MDRAGPRVENVLAGGFSRPLVANSDGIDKR